MWGLPFQVRADEGGENTAVGGLMIHYQGADHGSFLTGPSVHNNRTERLWREVVHCILFIFRNIFCTWNKLTNLTVPMRLIFSHFIMLTVHESMMLLNILC